MKTALLFLFLINTGCKGGVAVTADKMVYVCDSKGAKRYHFREHCRGLSNCSVRVLKITLEKAKEEGKTLCKWED
ncbi:hypothetical protein [Mucilaginibacter sp. AK015]|uniref:hypothetical protein n=1 Tax=Mucilaginibacter sp. AK015 TaxID=2723072 RepID=UPI001608282F|nr:hypothetical protein [Mucilaginibacter sp. AK015]MBB5395079.1 5-bromo-4-chloroindolyl phosphate hydrolysis protein [Mucilaginibacter sp. AK015]